VARTASVERNTKETQVQVTLGLDGTGARSIETPVPFLSHMLDAFARHGVFDLELRAAGDVEIDGHHTVEDVGLVLGTAFERALGDRAGLVRYGWATLPMDEVLATVAVDFSGRPAFVWKVDGLAGKWIGDFDCELAKEFFAAFASATSTCCCTTAATRTTRSSASSRRSRARATWRPRSIRGWAARCRRRRARSRRDRDRRRVLR
jgi:imidazoleglycerol-phosphate dehydratase